MTDFAPSSPDRLRVDVWSDIACPWCYIGKRRFERALEGFPHRDRVEVVWRSFELDPGAPASDPRTSADMLGQKTGRPASEVRGMLAHVTGLAAAEGLAYDFDRVRLGNTFDAHRLVHLAAGRGLGPQMKERLLRAHFEEGEPVGDPDTLVRLAGEVGLDPEEARAALADPRTAEAVRHDEAQARALGIGGVPFFVLGGKYGVSGAQSPEVFRQALDQVWNELHPAPLTLLAAADGDDCADGACALPDAR